MLKKKKKGGKANHTSHFKIDIFENILYNISHHAGLLLSSYFLIKIETNTKPYHVVISRIFYH